MVRALNEYYPKMEKIDTEKLRIMTIFGTRPEIIRLSRILPKMDKYFDHITVYTQQSYDYELSKIFFEELELRNPDYLLEVKADTIGEQIANIIREGEKVILKERPDGLLILGDTNTTLVAIVAKRLHIPIFHMEAGNRCFDWEVPEETNRALIDIISDFNFPYTERGRGYLLHQGIHPSKIFVTGSPLTEVYHHYKARIDKSEILKELNLKKEEFFVISFHREENVDQEKNLKTLVESFNAIAEKYQYPLIVSLHPRTKARIKDSFKLHPLIRLNKPFGILEYITLEKNAFCDLSDSGTIQEESSLIGFKALQLRTNLERPEAFEKGAMILAGIDTNIILNAIEIIHDEYESKENIIVPNDYIDLNVSSKVAKLILGLAGRWKYYHK